MIMIKIIIIMIMIMIMMIILTFYSSYEKKSVISSLVVKIKRQRKSK